MKIGLNLVGISHTKDGSDNYFWQKSNIKENIIDSIGTENKVNVYLTTYFNDENTKNLIDYYSPKNINILNWEKSDQRLTYISSLEQLLDEDIDLIISTRFDIFFHKKFNEINNFDFSKFNFLFKEAGWWGNSRFTTDNFYVFSKEYLKFFIESIDELYKKPPRPGSLDLHGIYNFILPKIGENNINIVSDEEQLSTKNNFYNLTRFI